MNSDKNIKHKQLKILMPASEVAPLVKVGGLADVVGSLPKALNKLGCDARVIIPKYGCIDEKKYKLKKIFSNIKICDNKKNVKINLWQCNLPTQHAVSPIYLIECNKYFGSKKVYFKNNAERFLFFSSAVLQILPIIKFQPDIIHCHDFHTALIPGLLKTQKKLNTFYKNIKSVFTIHNLNYQGKSEIKILSTGNLTEHSLKSLSQDAKDGDINFMVQGIINADAVNTVSPTYAKEITTPIYSAGLDKVIKQNKNKIIGILNGIDIDFFNSTTDKFIKQKYSIETLNKKVLNKLALQKQLGLPQDENIALVGFISRLAWQKGVELITDKLINSKCQFVFLGTQIGGKQYENQLKKLAKKYPDKVSAQIKFNTKLAQQIYAGSDIFLMPSRFEPCGLGQMIAMRYGTVPIVRKTGGLADTIINYQLSIINYQFKSTGFIFKKFDEISLHKALQKALKIYYQHPKIWRQLQINCMKKDFSWNKSAKKYLDFLYC
ncbi:MAG: glycogen/starch synthase [Patescibacteria group bacterium]